MPDKEATGSIQLTLSLQDIYDVCCNPCRDHLIDLIARHAQSVSLRQAIRQQLSPDEPPPEPQEEQRLDNPPATHAYTPPLPLGRDNPPPVTTEPQP